MLYINGVMFHKVSIHKSTLNKELNNELNTWANGIIIILVITILTYASITLFDAMICILGTCLTVVMGVFTSFTK